MYQYRPDEVFEFIIRNIKHPSAEYSFLNDRYDDVHEWAKSTREWVKSLLHYSPEPVPFDPVYTEETDFGSYIRKKLYFYTAPYCKVPAYLLIPKKLRDKAPAIIALHDHSGRFYYGKEKIVDHKENLPMIKWFQEYRYGGRGYASALAEQGYVVMVIDSLGFGERTGYRTTWLRFDPEDLISYREGTEEYIQAHDREMSKRWNSIFEAIYHSGATYIGIMVWDDMRSVDFVASLPEVDSSRIGCVGLSMGGFRAVWLGAMDERIKCSCSVGYMTKFEDISPFRLPQAWALPGLHNKLPYPDLASLMAPRDFMVQYCENDQLFDLSTMVDACNKIRKVYEKAGYPDKFVSKGYPVGHMFNYEMQEDAFEFFRERLQP